MEAEIPLTTLNVDATGLKLGREVGRAVCFVGGGVRGVTVGTVVGVLSSPTHILSTLSFCCPDGNFPLPSRSISSPKDIV